MESSEVSKLRLTDLFLKLLDTQFMQPESSHNANLWNAQQYALQLSVHPNHLNRVLKATTGKSTTQHIAGRILSEAKSGLLRGNQNIAELAYSLGFGYASNFQVFFKRHTGQSANAFRKQHAANS
jgi:AraC-like DNA-binding protein